MRQPGSGMRLVQNAPLMVVLLLMVDSLHFVFARLLLPHLPPATSAMYVMVIAALEIAFYLMLKRRVRLRIFRQHAGFFLTIGVLVAGATVLSYTAVNYIDPGTASFLAQTSTLFALGFSLFWLREQLARMELLGSLVALVGVFTISFQPGDLLQLGSLLVLIGAMMYAVHAAVVKRYGGEIDFGNFFLFRVASIALFLCLFATGSGQLVWPDLSTWLLLILTGSVDVVVSRMLYYLALRRLRMSFHAILLTLSPAITVLWSLALFQSRPTAQGLLGGLIVIVGIAMVTVRRRR